MVTLLLPLNRYQVKYELAEGRPYSKLDQLVLRAFKEEGAKTIQDLQQPELKIRWMNLAKP